MDNDEERVMHSKSDNIEIMINDEADEVLGKLFEPFKNRYQEDQELLRRSEFVFDYVRLLYRKYFNVILNCGGSYIDSPNCTKNKKATINPINEKDNKRFQYAVTIWLYQEEIGKNPDRITKVKPFINKYQWKGINFPSEKNDWKIFEKNNVTIALNVLYAKKEKIYPAYV